MKPYQHWQSLFSNATVITVLNIVLVAIAFLQTAFLVSRLPRLQNTQYAMYWHGSILSIICFAYFYVRTAAHLKRKYGRVWNLEKTPRPEDWLIVTISVFSMIVGFQGYPTLIHALPLPQSPPTTIIMQVTDVWYPTSSSITQCRFKLLSAGASRTDTLILSLPDCPNSDVFDVSRSIELTTLDKLKYYTMVSDWQLVP